MYAAGNPGASSLTSLEVLIENANLDLQNDVSLLNIPARSV